MFFAKLFFYYLVKIQQEGLTLSKNVRIYFWHKLVLEFVSQWDEKFYILSDGKEYPGLGNVVAVDRAMEGSTSSLMLKAQFDNSKGVLIPGMFAGALQESVGYPLFFIIVMLACTMTYVVTVFLKIDPEFGKKKQD